MNSRISGIIRFTIFLSLGLFLIWLSFRNIEFKEVASGLKEANYFWLIFSFAFSFIAFFSRARRWILLIKPLGYNPSFKNAYNATLSGYLANIALPRLGEFTKCVALGRKEDIPANKIIGTVVVERVIDLVTLFFLMTLLLLFGGEEVHGFLQEYILRPIGGKISSLFSFRALLWISVLAVAGAAFLMLYLFKERIRKTAFYGKLKSFLKDILDGLQTIRTLERRWEFILHTIIIWVNYLLMTWILLFAIPGTAHLNLADGLFLLVIGSLAMSAPVQSGFGAFHWVISRGLNVIFGVELTDGMVYATLSHESQMLLILVAGTISTILIYNVKKRATDPKK